MLNEVYPTAIRCPICNGKTNDARYHIYWHLILRLRGPKRDLNTDAIFECLCGFQGDATELLQHLGRHWRKHLLTYTAIKAMRDET